MMYAGRLLSWTHQVRHNFRKLGEDIAKSREILVTQAVVDQADGIDGITFEKICDVPPGAKCAYRVLYPLHQEAGPVSPTGVAE